MEEDKRIDDWLQSQFQPDFNEAIPATFLRDINQRLDAMEKGRQRKLGGWIWFSVFLFSGFIAVAAWFGIQKNEIKNQPLAKQHTIAKKQETISESNLNEKQTKPESVLTYKAKVGKYTSSFNLLEKPCEQKITDTKEEISLVESDLVNSVQSPNEESSVTSASPAIQEENKVLAQVDTLTHKNVLDSLKNQTKDKKKVNKLNWEAGFSFGVSGIISSFQVPDFGNTTSVSTYSASEYRQARKEQERSTSSWDISFRLKMSYNNWTFQSGLDYFQWGEQVKYSYSSISGINRYSYLSLPLNIGYDFRKGKFGVNPYAGASMGFCIQRNGQYLMTDLEHVAEEQAKQVIGTLSIGTELAYYSAAGVKVFILPVWRKSIGSVVESNPIFNKYQSFGMQMGIAFRF